MSQRAGTRRNGLRSHTPTHPHPVTPRPHLTTVPLVVRGYDVDFGGIVSNIVTVRWLEDVRTALLDRVTPMRAMVEGGVAPVVARLEVDYRRPVRLFDAVEGRVWTGAVGRSSLELFTEVVRPGTEGAAGAAVGQDEGSPDGGPLVYTAARQLMVFVDLGTGRPVPVPDAYRPADA